MPNNCPKCAKVFKKWTEYSTHRCSQRQYVPMDPMVKARVVKRAEMTWLKPHLIVPDTFEFVGSIGEDHFYIIRMAGHPLNGDTLSLEYIEALGLGSIN